MTLKVCLSANSLHFPRGGGHHWVYLNWALALCAAGCDVVWLEGTSSRGHQADLCRRVRGLKRRLERYGLADRLALWSPPDRPVDPEAYGCLSLDAVTGADLLLNFRYDLPVEIVRRARRSALVDIDPGLLQVWISKGQLHVAPHNYNFTIGETVGRPDARFPDADRCWHYTPPPVALDWWPKRVASPGAPYTTVSNWNTADEWLEEAGEVYSNDKRDGFLPFLDLPRFTDQRLELALYLGRDAGEQRDLLQGYGWRVRHSLSVSSTPWEYQQYLQRSRGEFSCVKPSCIRFQNAWISDRTICYLASGKPAVVQHTGPSRFLPNAEGLYRFRTLNEAVGSFEAIAADYDRACCAARALAEEHFDGRKVASSVLERTLS